MKNTLRSQLSFKLNYCLRLNKKPAVLLFFMALLLNSNLVHAQLPIFDDFESGWGNWNDGGNDCNFVNNNLINGNSNIRIRDNSGNNSSLYSDNINLTSYSSVTIEFLFYANSMENNENFYVEYDDGSNETTIANYIRGTHFNNGTVYLVSLTLDSTAYTFSNNSSFRIVCDASANNDQVYIDDINITGVPDSGASGPTNDDCSDAISLTPNTSCIMTTGTTVGATQSLSGCAGSADDDVWYSFVATSTDHAITVEAGSINDIVFQVFSGGCGGTSIECEDSTAGNSTETETLSGLTIGTTYYIRVYSYSSNTNRSGTFDICVEELPESVPPPPNDDCSDAISLTPSFVCNPVTGTTVDATQSLTGCTGTADDDVWYSFVATRQEHEVIVDNVSMFNIVFEVFEYSCNGNSLICENSTTSTATELATLTALNVGSTYYVRVYSYSSDNNHRGTFNICIRETCEFTNTLGSSSLACPSVDAGGIGTSGSDVNINCSINSTTLEASYLELGETSDYKVESIDYAPPFQFGCLEHPVSVNIDDVFSPKINLPFDFCFYGETYDSCVIGSNGVISFDADRLENTSSGWSTRNIPSNNNAQDSGGSYYFGPSIYGVHHDVDPSKGGEIGYQLITLDTGCQAFVTAWKDVPMYYDNSILYTGMMVFYEDTNIIEVYIEEKNLDGVYYNGGGRWNYGRACVGLQENQNNAIVPTGRNSNSTNWTTTNEAWRFTPDGTSITTLKWYENSISAANEIIDPDNDGQIEVSPTETTTYYAEVTYNLCSGATLVELDPTTVTVEGKKTWNGSQSTAWENANNWTPIGVPVDTNCITIPNTGNDPIMQGSTDGYGYNLSVENGATLTQLSNATLTIEDVIEIEPTGDIEVSTNASIIQITDVTTNNNTGSARVQRKVDGISYFDYVYWSSPVDIFDVENISPGTPSFAIYKWLPTEANGTVGNHGNWINSQENMTLGKGYIVRGLSGTTIANTAEFSGTLNNGRITLPISRGNYTGGDYAGIGNTATAEDDNWNLLGNPYPSAISLQDFVAANSDIDGTLYFWQHLTPATSAIDNPFYNGYVYNYSDSEYLAANSLGSTPPGFNDYIASGQGFFALMLDSAPSNSSVSFSNTMRGTYANNGFYRSATTTQEKHRIWLDLVSSDNTALSTLVGYTNGATDDIDRLYDGYLISQTGDQFYSLVSDEKLTIQGKGLPFVDTETIPLGYKINSTGTYTISINQVDGLFANTSQNIFLEDTELNIIHDIRANPYIFTSQDGVFDTRFILRFTNESLSIKDQEIVSDLEIRNFDNTLYATSNLSIIESFELFDVTGRLIHKNLNVESTNYNYLSHNLSKGTYIVKVELQNGSVISKKIII